MKNEIEPHDQELKQVAAQLSEPVRFFLRLGTRRDFFTTHTDVLWQRLAPPALKYPQHEEQIGHIGISVITALSLLEWKEGVVRKNAKRLYNDGLQIFQVISDETTRNLVAMFYVLNLQLDQRQQPKVFTQKEEEMLEKERILRALGDGETKATPKQLKKLTLTDLLVKCLKGQIILPDEKK